MPVLEHLALTGAALDRATDLRADTDWLAARWADPSARVLLLDDDRAPVRADGAALAFMSSCDVAAAPDDRYFLGLGADGAPYFAVLGTVPDAAASDGTGSISLREAGALLDDREGGMFVHAVSLAHWHSRHGFCASCGAPTRVDAGGHVRRCDRCSAEHFPRTDPAIIVLVTDGSDRCLLGHQPRWPDRRFSTLAGFVEPGESLEQAVEREVAEETGVVVGDARYAGSQPWPFPSSLMLGFFADAVDTTIEVDGEEISEAGWFSRDELLAAAETGDILLPGTISISRRLIEGWFGAELPGGW